MEELINFLIEIANFLKYGKFVNQNKSFNKELEGSTFINDDNAIGLRTIVTKQISNLIKKGEGKPTYAYFKKKNRCWYNIYVLNEYKKFYCRLEPTEIKDIDLPEKCYISL